VLATKALAITGVDEESPAGAPPPTLAHPSYLLGIFPRRRTAFRFQRISIATKERRD
jgi:hypothetical protein